MEDKSTVMMEGDSGLFDTKTQILELKDRIFLRSSTGYEARLTQATVDMAKGTVDSSRPVAVKLLNGTLDANGLHIVDNGALVVFDGGVSMLLNNMGDTAAKPAGTSETIAKPAKPAEAGARPAATPRK
jgi:lipopolysaccharide export system protein LptC